MAQRGRAAGSLSCGGPCHARGCYPSWQAGTEAAGLELSVPLGPGIGSWNVSRAGEVVPTRHMGCSSTQMPI